MAKPERSGWYRLLLRGPKGGLKQCLANAVTILSHDVVWSGVLAYDEFANGPITLKEPRWHPDDKPEGCKPGPWTDADDLRLCTWFARSHKLTITPRTAGEAVCIVAGKKRVHPVRDWLKSLKWDGKKRLDDWLIRLGGAEDSSYTRAVSANWMISAVARIFEPGCQADHALILEGAQGVGKSSLLRILGGDEWFLEMSADLSNKDAEQDLWCKWIVELSELDSLSRSEVTQAKGFITKRTPRFRASYDRRSGNYLRQCVFGGTTNARQYLKDDSGARRFWPILIPRAVNLAALRKERDQLWAESTHRYQAGEEWHFKDPALIKAAAEVAEERRQQDPWEEPVRRWLTNPNRVRTGVTTHQCLVDCLGFETNRLDRREEIRIGSVLRVLNWERRRERLPSGGLGYIYRPKEDRPNIGNSRVQKGTRDLGKLALVPNVPNVPMPTGVYRKRKPKGPRGA